MCCTFFLKITNVFCLQARFPAQIGSSLQNHTSRSENFSWSGKNMIEAVGCPFFHDDFNVILLWTIQNGLDSIRNYSTCPGNSNFNRPNYFFEIFFAGRNFFLMFSRTRKNTVVISIRLYLSIWVLLCESFGKYNEVFHANSMRVENFTTNASQCEYYESGTCAVYKFSWSLITSGRVLRIGGDVTIWTGGPAVWSLDMNIVADGEWMWLAFVSLRPLVLGSVNGKSHPLHPHRVVDRCRDLGAVGRAMCDFVQHGPVDKMSRTVVFSTL